MASPAHYPRYLVIPRLGMSAAPFLLYQAAARALGRLLAEGHAFDAIDAHYLSSLDGVAAVLAGLVLRPAGHSHRARFGRDFLSRAQIDPELSMYR